MSNLFQEYLKRYEQAYPNGGVSCTDWVAEQWMQDNGLTDYKSEAFKAALMRLIDEDGALGGAVLVKHDKLMREDQREENRKLRLAYPELSCAHEHDGKCHCNEWTEPIDKEKCAACADFCVESWQWDKYIGDKYPEAKGDEA